MTKRKEENWETRISTLHAELAAIRERFLLLENRQKKPKLETPAAKEKEMPIQEMPSIKAEPSVKKKDNDLVTVASSRKKQCLYTEIVDLITPSPSPSPSSSPRGGRSPSSSPRARPPLPEVIFLPPPPSTVDAGKPMSRVSPASSEDRRAVSRVPVTDPSTSRDRQARISTGTSTSLVRSDDKTHPEGDQSEVRRGKNSRTDAESSRQVSPAPPRVTRSARKEGDLPPPSPALPTPLAQRNPSVPPVIRSMKRDKSSNFEAPKCSPASAKPPPSADVSCSGSPVDSTNTPTKSKKSTLHSFVSVFYPVLNDVPDWVSGPYQEFKDDSIRLCNKCLSLCEWIYFLTSQNKELCASCVKEEGCCESSKTFLREGVVQYLSALDSTASSLISTPTIEEVMLDEDDKARTLCLFRKFISSNFVEDESSAVILKSFVQSYNASNVLNVSEKVAAVVLDLLGYRCDSSGFLHGLKLK